MLAENSLQLLPVDNHPRWVSAVAQTAPLKLLAIIVGLCWKRSAARRQTIFRLSHIWTVQCTGSQLLRGVHPSDFVTLVTVWSNQVWNVLQENMYRFLQFYYPRDAMLARVIVIAMFPSVCLSVRLSVTRRYCVKTKKARGMISSPSGSPKTLFFWRQISSPNSKGFPPNGGFKHGSVGKIQRFFSFKRLYLENGSRYGQGYY